MGAGVQGALEQLASAPVKEVAITELDIANAPADDFTAVVQACLNVEKCTSITIWGVSDAVSLLLLLSRRQLRSNFIDAGFLEAGREPAAFRQWLRAKGRL